MIQQLNYFSTHQYEIILYGEASYKDQLKTINFLKDYAKKNNL